MNANDDGGDDGFDDFAHAAGAALRQPAPDDGLARVRSARQRHRAARVAAATGAIAVVFVAGAALMTANQDDSQRLVPADVPPPAPTDFPTSTSTPTTTLPSTSVPEVPEPPGGPPLTPEAVRQSFADASGNPELGALCGFGWDSCDITEIRTREDSVVLTLQIDENRSPDDLPEDILAETNGRSAFGILGDQFPQLDYVQVTNEAGLVLADVKCDEAFPTILRCP